MRTALFAFLLFLPFVASAKDVVRTYTFPDKSYTVTFPCIGKLEEDKFEEKTYEMYRANMICDDRKQTFTLQYFKFFNIPGMKKASLEDKQYFLREFRDMVRQLYMGDYDTYSTEDEKTATVLGLPALTFSLIGDKPDIRLKIAGQAVLDQNNALYFSSIFVKDKENIYNIKEFFGSLQKGTKEGSK